MKQSLRVLKSLIQELEKTHIQILSVDGDRSDPKDFYITDFLVNNKKYTEYESYIKSLGENVIASKILRTFEKREEIKHLLISIKADFGVIINPAYHHRLLPNLHITTRKTLDISYHEEVVWIAEINSPTYLLDTVFIKIDLLLEMLLSITDSLLLDCEVKEVIKRLDNYYSYSYSEWNKSTEPLLELLSILLKEKKIKEVQWKQFGKVFNEKTKTQITDKIEWLGNISEFKMFIDTLFSTGKFAPSRKKWEIASRCFSLIQRPDINWATLKGQKKLTYPIKYLDTIVELFR